MMNDWLKQNGLTLFIYAVGIAIAFTALSGRVSAVEEKIASLQELTERLIVIEERTGNNREDILEIKSDIKDLKAHFNLQ